MFGILQQFNQQARVPVQPSAQQAYPPPAPSPVDLGDDDYLTGRQVKAYLQQVQQTSLDPRFQQMASVAAQGTLAVVQQRHAESFQKWGPEIHGLIANLPPTERSLDNLERVVKFVRSEHLDEVLEDQKRQLLQQFSADQGSPGLRSNGAPGAGPVPQAQSFSLANDKIPQEWRDRAVRAGLTDQQVAEFARANNMTVEQFYTEHLLAGNVMTDKGVVRG